MNKEVFSLIVTQLSSATGYVIKARTNGEEYSYGPYTTLSGTKEACKSVVAKILKCDEQN